MCVRVCECMWVSEFVWVWVWILCLCACACVCLRVCVCVCELVSVCECELCACVRVRVCACVWVSECVCAVNGHEEADIVYRCIMKAGGQWFMWSLCSRWQWTRPISHSQRLLSSVQCCVWAASGPGRISTSLSSGADRSRPALCFTTIKSRSAVRNTRRCLLSLHSLCLSAHQTLLPLSLNCFCFSSNLV